MHKRRYRNGLVLGKFMPLHNGHIALFRFALQHCDTLTVLHCYHSGEPIPGAVRKQWLEEFSAAHPTVRLLHLDYDPATLPDTSVSSREVSRRWAEKIRTLAPDIDVLFSSEPYGAYVAAFNGIDHCLFDLPRALVPVSATHIRDNPLRMWDFLPLFVRPYFVRKICLAGTESTGKSTLAERLAAHYGTRFVPEKARDIVAHTEEVVFEDLHRIAETHATAIQEEVTRAEKLLFIDTDVRITQSYARFLFDRELEVPDRIAAANRMDLILFLEPDCAYVQDGTRLPKPERDRLSLFHEQAFGDAGCPVIRIGGDWEERFAQAKAHIDRLILNGVAGHSA